MREPEEITGVEDIIDSRDLLRRCEFLEEHYDDLKRAVADAEEELGEAKTKKAKAAAQKSLDEAKDELNTWDGGKFLGLDPEDETTDEYQEMVALRDVVDELGEGSCRDGDASLIAEGNFTDYCKELVQDIGDLPKDLPGYIENNIDWDGVAGDLQADYSTVTLFGNDYLYRNC